MNVSHAEVWWHTLTEDEQREHLSGLWDGQHPWVPNKEGPVRQDFSPKALETMYQSVRAHEEAAAETAVPERPPAFTPRKRGRPRKRG